MTDEVSEGSRKASGLEQFDELFLEDSATTEVVEESFEQRAIGDVVNPLEQINSVFKRTSSRIWLGVGGLALLVVGFVIWGFVAQQIVTTQTQVILLPKSGLYPVSVLQTSVVQQISVPEGTEVTVGQTLGTVSVPGAGTTTITAPIAGTVVTVQAATGQILTAGSTFLNLAPKGEETVAIGLISPSAVGSVANNQPVTIAIPTVNPTRYGRLVGTVEYVGSVPIAQGRIIALFGNTATASAILQAGPAYEVRIDLKPASTPSGYTWTVGNGPSQHLPLDSTGVAFIETSHKSLASRAFG